MDQQDQQLVRAGRVGQRATAKDNGYRHSETSAHKEPQTTSNYMRSIKVFLAMQINIIPIPTVDGTVFQSKAYS